MNNVELLSNAAIKFLVDCDYQHKNHDERIALIKAARELYPNEEEEAE